MNVKRIGPGERSGAEVIYYITTGDPGTPPLKVVVMGALALPADGPPSPEASPGALAARAVAMAEELLRKAAAMGRVQLYGRHHETCNGTPAAMTHDPASALAAMALNPRMFLGTRGLRVSFAKDTGTLEAVSTEAWRTIFSDLTVIVDEATGDALAEMRNAITEMLVVQIRAAAQSTAMYPAADIAQTFGLPWPRPRTVTRNQATAAQNRAEAVVGKLLKEHGPALRTAVLDKAAKRAGIPRQAARDALAAAKAAAPTTTPPRRHTTP